MGRGIKICYKGFKLSLDPEYHRRKAERLAKLCPIDCTRKPPVAIEPAPAPQSRSNGKRCIIINFNENVKVDWN
jgi:hypothetical protein